MASVARFETSDESPYLTPVQGAKHLGGISVAAFRKRMVRAGIVPCRLGRNVLYLRVDIDACLQRNRREVLRSRARRSA